MLFKDPRVWLRLMGWKKKKQRLVLSTCYHAVSSGDSQQHQLDEAHFGAGLQVANTLLKDGSEDAPDLSLAGGLTLVQKLHHAHNAVRVLDNEVHL